MSTDWNREIAETIIEQLGGNEFKMMTGSKGFTYSDSSLTFTLAKNPSRANCVTITLTGSDLYDVRFRRVTHSLEAGIVDKVVREFTGLYCDQLRRVFEEVTKLRTSLTRIYATEAA